MRARIVCGNPTVHHERVVVIEQRVRHAEGLKHVLGSELAQRLLGCSLYHHTEQKVVRVAVNPLLSGGVVQPSLTNHKFENVFWRIEVRYIVT
jgi:hypothetical protein